MTLINPTPEVLRFRHETRLADLAQRAEKWQTRRRHFQRKMIIAGGVLLVVTARFAALSGGMSWQGYGAFLVSGGLFAWLIVQMGLGILRGLLLYGLGSFAVWFLCAACGWWTSDGNAGALILMMMGWLAWIVIGGVLGMINEQFDGDNLQV